MRLNAFVAVLCVAGFATSSQAVEKPEKTETTNAPKVIADCIKEYQPKVHAIKDAFKLAIDNNKFEEGLAKYNQDRAALKAAFILTRTVEYKAARVVYRYGVLSARTTPGSGEEETNGIYLAPAEMMCEAFEYNQQSRIPPNGDHTYKWCNATLDNHTRVSVTLLAKPGPVFGGATSITVKPVITWKYIDPAGRANADWDVIIAELTKKQ